jgi:hypothetical protein
MKSVDYLPKQDQAFLVWALNFTTQLAGMLVRVGFPEAVFQELMALRDVFSEKLTTAEAPVTRTKSAVQAKNDARKAFEKFLRQVIREYLTYNHAVTNVDRDNLGLPIHKSGRTPTPVATIFPWVQVIVTLIRHLRFDFGGVEGSKAKLEGQHGMELVGRIGGEKPAGIHELTLSYFDTHTPLVIGFEEGNRGKTFWFAVRWENTRGEKGPWSEIRSAVIP